MRRGLFPMMAHAIGTNGEDNIHGYMLASIPQAQQQNNPPRSDCGRFVDDLVASVESINRQSPESYDRRRGIAGNSLLLRARRYARELGTNTVDGFQRDLTRDGQNDGVYQHVLGHAAATIVGGSELTISITADFTCGVTAKTGDQLTYLAMLCDEIQRDNPNLQHRRGESETEIRDNHAGRLVGGQMMRGLWGKFGI